MNDTKIQFDFDNMIRRTFPKMGEVIKKEIKSNLAKVSHGYIEVYKGKTRWVSKTGEPPNNRSFDLTQSVGYKMVGGDLIVGEGSDRVNYATYLENPSSKNRPNVKPSITDKKNEIDSIIEDSLRDALRP